MKQLGIALGADRLLALLPNGRRLDTSEVGDLGAAFAQLKQATGYRRAVVWVALVPPLVELRRCSLPPLRDAERRRVLARDAARYFLGARERQVVGTAGAAFAAAAPARLVEEIERAVAAIGWRLAAIVPAHAAWLRFAASRRPRDVVVRLSGATEVLRLDAGDLVERRRYRTGEEPPAPDGAVEFAGGSPAGDPFVVAARLAPRNSRWELCSDATHAARHRLARRVAGGLLAAGVALLVLAAGTDFWGLRRDFGALQARRAELAPQVAAALALRDSLAGLEESVVALRNLATTRPRWSVILTDFAEHLPRDAHVVAFRGTRDSVLIEGVARQAAAVFQAVRLIPRVSGVRADAPIRRDISPDGTVREQFALSTLLRGGAVP